MLQIDCWNPLSSKIVCVCACACTSTCMCLKEGTSNQEAVKEKLEHPKIGCNFLVNKPDSYNYCKVETKLISLLY